MVEQNKRYRRKTRQQPPKSPGFLGPKNLSEADIEAEEKALREAFLWFDPDEVTQQDYDTSEPLSEAATAEQPEPEPEPEMAPTFWPLLSRISVNPVQMDRNLIITARRQNPSHAAFDVLRARLFQALSEHGWKRVAITSPTRDCGKTFVSINLAIALSRYENCRTVLLDLDMRNPSIAKTLGEQDVGSMSDYLRGKVPLTDHFHRFGENELNIGDNLAIAMNDRVEPYSSELLQEPETRACLEEMEQALQPNVILFDLPPALAHDDVIAFRDNFDGVLVVIDGTVTTGAQVQEVMRRLGDDCPLLGVVLNKAEDATGNEYGY
ncbi:Tyrosine-protein kinase YwqD [Thalassovita gelatinovora]|uniref:Tyrosine-protein kinase YwqD n=1 Tax=Thalassovita gelatinovora TaxID=53501 RepID=A0A0P1FWI8_THAGE|nr:CpsD/CapB family tyrosine-protein kinase [Thalassovita gelatinovora]QIZ81178.1 CpsD/CapB family tyrosine-protein kinase [Thalassovita gelatinovora]CUH64768.1 Tyrosine-protein kinase YwqD [Thalassovita gelatinovora]SEP92403.1 Chromosome partitioning ATPase, Mrp family, contains Fe-S cluster [Thalassovita gelatinovora]